MEVILLIGKTEITQNNGVNQIAISKSSNSKVIIFNSSKDHISNLIRDGKYQKAVDEFTEVYKQIGELHPLHPLYSYKPKELGSKIVFEHHPVSGEVAKEFPIKYKGGFSIIDKDIGEGETIESFLNRKHFTQEKVRIDVKYIETWIGEKRIVDPISLEQQAVKEGKWYMIPAPLLPPIKAKLILTGNEENVIVDYLELRMTEINRQDNIGVISNEHQEDSPLIFTLAIQSLFESNLTTDRFDTNLNFKVREGFKKTVVAEIMFLNFMKYIKSSKRMILFDLEKTVNFFEAQISTLDLNDDLALVNVKMIDDRLSILNDLHAIEHYFRVDFQLPENMTDEDFENIRILSAIINEEEVVTNLIDFYVTFNGVKGLEKIVNDDKEKPIMITANSSDQLNIDIFGAKIENINMSYTVEGIKIKSPERIKKKIKLFDEGEIIKVEFTPVEKNKLSIRYSINKHIE